MQPLTISVSGTGSTVPFVMDYMQNPFNIGIGVVATGTLASTAWRLEHCFVDFNPPVVSTTGIVWFCNSAIGTSNNSTVNSTAASLDMNYAFPIRAIRLNVITAVATSIVTATIIQASEAP